MLAMYLYNIPFSFHRTTGEWLAHDDFRSTDVEPIATDAEYLVVAPMFAREIAIAAAVAGTKHLPQIQVYAGRMTEKPLDKVLLSFPS